MSETKIHSHAPSAGAEVTPVLTVDHLSVQFGAFKALTDVSIEVHPGETVGVIGPNGAGKSTLVNALSGVVPPTTGSVLLEGRDLGRSRPVRRSRLGLVRTFQTAQLFGSLTVDSNIGLARRGSSSAAVDTMLDEAMSVLRLTSSRETTADRLSGGQRKLVELVRALATEPKVLLLDEPVAGVPMRDREAVLDLMRRQVTDRGVSILLIEHDMDFVSSVCDRIYVMNAGSLIAHGTWNEISKNPTVLEAYLGADPTASTNVDE